ncbi:ATP synthase subunit f, mitochondrial [Callorhinchus milii]|uniref:ATP synthase subunit f, mitochondrial-like protein n=1 Tax=Callorhinchus milii TaxID=7868 RepID=V9LJN7_CALMI|nr:ATP synthase subunit f, mitochondrial [Callorhinchus milii]|eukprot:gi/632975572/ref/XP_007904303.1/ PREDICTED: ATP synthase subunit f, mitochondrial [Callorhinchus milii]
MGGRAAPIAMKLMDVKLKDLNAWVLSRSKNPIHIFAAICRGHDRFYKKYIDVKKGEIGGVAMPLMAYVVLSYIWNYKHIKQDRWRKYH